MAYYVTKYRVFANESRSYLFEGIFCPHVLHKINVTSISVDILTREKRPGKKYCMQSMLFDMFP